MRDPVQKWLPDLLCLLGIQPLIDHADDERVFGIHMGLLAPMIVEEVLGIEAHELPDQTPIRIVRRRFDGDPDGAEELGKIVNPQRHLAYHPEAATSAALERPE